MHISYHECTDMRVAGYHEQINICSSVRFFIKDLMNTLLTCCSINRRKVSGDSSSTDFRNSSRIFMSKVPNQHSLPRLSKRALFSLRNHVTIRLVPVYLQGKLLHLYSEDFYI